MTAQQPELLVIAGPDEGRRIRLAGLPVKLGRSSQVGVRLSEQYVSREQAELAEGPDGVLVRVLSGKGQDINGQTYKKGKEVLLDTGDVLEMGRETQILFVAAGDDPEQALAEVADGRRRREAEAAAGRAEAEQRARQKQQAEAQAQAAAEAERIEQRQRELDENESPAELGRAEVIEAKRRRKRIFMGLAIYAGAMLVLFLLGSLLLKGDDAGPAAGMPPKLEQEQVTAALNPKPDQTTPSFAAAAEAIERARDLYVRRREPGAAYRAIEAYNTYLASATEDDLPELSDQANYRRLKEQLAETIRQLYYNGYTAMQQQRWPAARERFERIVNEVPDRDNPLRINAMAALDYIRDRTRRPDSGPGRW